MPRRVPEPLMSRHDVDGKAGKKERSSVTCFVPESGRTKSANGPRLFELLESIAPQSYPNVFPEIKPKRFHEYLLIICVIDASLIVLL